MSVVQETLGANTQATAPDELEFKRLPTWKQIGLAGLCDCKNEFFRTNLSMATTLLSFLFVFIILLNLDEEFDVDTWGGRFNGTLACETESEDFVAQKTSGITSFSYVIAGFFILLLGIYDYNSWKERDALWRETHLLSPEEIQQQRELMNGGVEVPTRRSFVSVATANTAKTTFSVEHEEIVKRRRYTEYIMGKRGSPALLVRQPIWSIFFAGSLVFLAVTGLLFHASLTVTAKRLDDFALWVVISLLVAYAWSRYVADGVPIKQCRKFQDNPRRSSLLPTFVFVGIAAVFDFAFFIYLDDITDRDFIRASLIAAFFLFSVPMFLHFCYNERRVGSSWTLLVVSLVCVLAGYLLNEFDVPGESLCFPDSFFQPHALWHVISAVGVAALILFFRSDFYLDDTPIDGENSPRLLTKLANFDPRNLFFGTPGTPGSVVADDESSVGGVMRQRSRQSDGYSTGRRRKARPLRANDEETIEMWFCMHCEFKDNTMDNDLKCKRCGKARPALDQFIAIPVTSSGDPSQNTGKRMRQSSKGSVTSGTSLTKTRQVRQGTGKRPGSKTRTRRPNSATRRVNNNEGGTNPNVQKMVDVARRNVIRTVNSQGSGSVTGKSVSTAKTPVRNSRPRLASGQGKVRRSNNRSGSGPVRVSNDRGASGTVRISNDRKKATLRRSNKNKEDDVPI